MGLANKLLRFVPAFAVLAAPPVAAQRTPATGRDLLQTMRTTYGNRWFKSLIFTQATTQRDSTGKERVSTWYESLRYTPERGTQLRIDIGDPSQGNGVIYSPDSLWVFRAGKQVAARPGGNLLLPLIEGVYVQSVDRTAHELAPSGVDLRRAVLTGQSNGRPVWTPGALPPAPTTPPPFRLASLT